MNRAARRAAAKGRSASPLASLTPRRPRFATPAVLPDPASEDAARLFDAAWSQGSETARGLLARYLGVPVRGAMNPPGGTANPAFQAHHQAQLRRLNARRD